MRIGRFRCLHAGDKDLRVRCRSMSVCIESYGEVRRDVDLLDPFGIKRKVLRYMLIEIVHLRAFGIRAPRKESESVFFRIFRTLYLVALFQVLRLRCRSVPVGIKSDFYGRRGRRRCGCRCRSSGRSRSRCRRNGRSRRWCRCCGRNRRRCRFFVKDIGKRFDRSIRFGYIFHIFVVDITIRMLLIEGIRIADIPCDGNIVLSASVQIIVLRSGRKGTGVSEWPVIRIYLHRDHA